MPRVVITFYNWNRLLIKDHTYCMFLLQKVLPVNFSTSAPVFQQQQQQHPFLQECKSEYERNIRSQPVIVVSW